MATTTRTRCVLRIHFHLAEQGAGEEVFARLLTLVEDITPCYQPHPPDTVDAELTGALRFWAPRGPYEIASVLRLRALAHAGISSTAGIGPSPMIAAMAAAATPHGQITVVGPDPVTVTAFLRPRHVATLPGVGPATAKTLAQFGILTIGQLADTPPPTLARLLGTQTARELNARARGIDDRPAQRAALVRSTTASHRFAHDELDPDQHHRALLSLAEELGQRLRASKEVCTGLAIVVRYADNSSTTRNKRLPEPTAHTAALTHTSLDLHRALGLQRARVRSISLRAEGLTGIEAAFHQLLLDPGDDKARRIEQVADAARAKYGPHIIGPAALAAQQPSPPSPAHRPLARRTPL
ncbi:helix-hairpin-helix domain-containing protein [Streptomyces mauvecolor]|uniref:Helix-hairpin-helix domain-containing protein n=1 Tax=Streptomyces mauvecolor TaxID=58345 RepID=A0ABV9UHI2_9ACTN